MSKVSIIIPSYNHDKYVTEAIQSVLNQTFQDFEIVITDDGSKDKTVEKIKEFKDPRVKLFCFEKNKGAAVAANNCLKNSKGEFIAMLSSDDVFLPDKLEKEVKFLNEHPNIGAVFTNLIPIDEEGKEIDDEKIFDRRYFEKENRSRYEWLNFFFKGKNALAHPSVLIRRECYDKVGFYNERYAQIPDWDLWVRLCMNYEIHILTERLLKIRILKNKANASAERPDSIRRIIWETHQMLKNFLNIKDIEEFLKIFPEALEFGKLESELIPFYLAMMALKCNLSVHEHLAIDILYSILSDPKISKKIEKKYGFRSIDLIKITGELDTFNVAENRQQKMKIEEMIKEAKRSKEELERKEVALRNAKSALLGAEKNLEEKIDELKFVKSSKFWKLRNIYIAIKNILMLGQLGKLAKTSALVIKRDGLAVFFRRLNIFYKEQLIPKENVGKKIVGEKPQERWPDNLPLVSVVIPCFNYGSFVRGAMDSVLAQTFQNFEIIIIDDGSTDKETTFALKNINHPKTKVIFQENQGLAETRNRGAELAKGKYVCFLDADDMLEPTYLEKTLLLLEADENLGCAYSWLQCFGDDDSIWHTQDLNPYRMRDANLAASHSVVRKSAWEKIRNSNGKGFLSKYNGYFEDWVFWIDMIQAGYGGKVIKEPLIKYRIHKKSLSATHKPGYEKKLKELKKDRHKFFSSKSFAEKMCVTVNSSIKIMNPLENLSGESNYSHSEKSILFVVPWLICGGAETVLFEAIKGLQKEGFSIYIITTEFSSNEWKEKFLKITPFVYDSPSILYKENLFDFLVNFLETRRVGQLCGIHSIFFYEFLSRIRKHFPKLFVSDMLHNDLEQGYIMRSIEKDEFTNRHIVISNRIKEKMMRKGISEDKISVVYSGIDTQNELNPDNISRKNDENIRLLYLGRMSEEKRPLDFLRIAEKFKHDKKFIFLMAGDGPLRGKVEKFIKKNAIKNLKLLGIANPREVLRDNNIILITSSIEGLPMSMMEAMSMENVVISTNVGEVGKAIISGENGYLVESIGDIDDFAEKIKYLSENREELKKMGKNSRKFAVEKYDVRRMQQEYVNLFNNT